VGSRPRISGRSHSSHRNSRCIGTSARRVSWAAYHNPPQNTDWFLGVFRELIEKDRTARRESLLVLLASNILFPDRNRFVSALKIAKCSTSLFQLSVWKRARFPDWVSPDPFGVCVARERHIRFPIARAVGRRAAADILNVSVRIGLTRREWPIVDYALLLRVIYSAKRISPRHWCTRRSHAASSGTAIAAIVAEHRARESLGGLRRSSICALCQRLRPRAVSSYRVRRATAWKACA